jgi:hypothetical protein
VRESYLLVPALAHEGCDYRPGCAGRLPSPTPPSAWCSSATLTIQSTEPRALIELSEALRSAAGEIEFVHREGGES